MSDTVELRGSRTNGDAAKEVEGSRAEEGLVRVLSYNFNILPRGCGGFQKERIDAFLGCVEEYDILILQEVYASSILPYFLQRRICFQKQLLDDLKVRGFHHYVISKQPSYRTILRRGVLSDNGLIIASRFPIGERGSYTFRRNEGVEHSVCQGCLFAEIEVPLPGGVDERVIFFNVHLRPDESDIASSAQVMETYQFIHSVIENLHNDSGDVSNALFVVAGDFNINGIDLHNVGQPTKRLSDLMSGLQSLGGGLREIIFDTHGYHPPTRPSKLFFPAQSKLNRNSIAPQRQDYFFVTPSVGVRMSQIRKFVASSCQPYVYLSDHFGVAAILGIPATGRKMSQEMVTRPRLNVSLAEEVVHERSNPFHGTKMEVVPLLLLTWAATYFSWWFFLTLGAGWMLIWWFSSRIGVLSNERRFATVTSAVVEGKEPVTLNQTKDYEILRGVYSIAELWHRAVYFHKKLPCLGEMNSTGTPEWLTYTAVDALVRELGTGLCALGAAPGDVIGVSCPASSRALVLDLVCATYGFATLPLVGRGTTIRNLIDEYNVKVAFTSRSAVASLLTCRSRSLETIVHMQAFSDAEDSALARDVGIALVSCDVVCRKGRSQNVSTLPHITGDTLFSLVVDTTTSSEEMKVVRTTHADVLRNIQILAATSVLPTSRQKHLVLHFAPFYALFNRIFALGIFAHGSSVAAAEGGSQGVFRTFRPTIVLATPSIFATSAIQLKRANERYGHFYSWLFGKIYHFRSVLINVHCRDSSVLRFIFFRNIQRQMGGKVEKIVLCASEESVSDQLEEHITLCYAPCLREVLFIPSEGVFCIDGIPAPGLRVELEPFDEPSKEAKIGQLVLIRDDGERHQVPIAAKWNDAGTLRLMGSPNGVLLPLRCEYVMAAELERIFGQSRYVNDIFLYAKSSQPIIAIVSPNRDTLEFEWQQHQQKQQQAGKSLSGESMNPSWMDLSRFALDFVLSDFRRIAEENGLPDSQVPEHVHLHPHTFKDHENFLTPYAGIRRQRVLLYFKSVVDRFYLDTNSPASQTPCYSSSDDESLAKESPEEHVSLRVPIAIDIGGTFAKILYVHPPGKFNPPDYLVHEASSLSERLNMRTLQFFDKPEDAKHQLKADPSSTVGTVRFAKIPSKRIPDFVSYLSEVKALDLYKEVYQKNVRATGGGAFKYATLFKKKMDATFEVMREMDAVVQGLSLVIQSAPDSIFTVDPPTGMHYPHKLQSPGGEGFSPYPCLLVNIGSGISIIKCLGPDGSHVRVGGSPIGGATFWGLVRTITDVTSWEEVMEIMRLDGPGDNRNVDLLVGDIYGYNAKDLPAMLSVDTVASTFGKLGTGRSYEVSAGANDSHNCANDEVSDVLSPNSHKSNLKDRKKFSSIDVVRSLLNMISSNITQLVYLHSRVQNVSNIFFAGGFVRNNPIIWSHISSTLQYWSRGESYAHFLKYDGYLGALGTATMASHAATA